MGEERKIRQVRSARQMPVRVQLLDDEILDVAVDKRAVGWVLFDIVCEQLNVIEKDYFGLNFINPEGVKYWLDNEKKIAKQMKGLVSLNLCFEIKFYPIDPLQMVEDITRYQLCLQIRRDIVNERVPCSTVTYALLGSFTAQSELGDYEVEDFGSGTSYLKDIQFAPKQDRDLLAQIAKLHKQHKGMTPEEAEIKFLENAEKLQFYGVEQHPAKDAEGKDISLGVCASGIIVYKDRQQVNRFVWPKILKMSYKRNKFYIKIRPGEFENFASLIGFRTVSVKMAKRLWKICVEHHSFFRFKEPEPVKSLSVIPRFGSRFRYSGRTQYQSRQYVTAEDRDMPSFDRVLSKRGTFGGRTQNMRKRDDDRKRQRDAMRREPPPPPVQQDFGPPQTKIPKERHEEPNGTPTEPRRTPPEPKHTPPEPKHAPPIAPKPKPQIAPKPKPVPRGPGSIDSGSRGSLNDSFEDVPDRRSRMEKMNAVMTPLAAVMQKSLQQNKHPEDEEVVENHPRDDEHHDRHTDDEYEEERDWRPMTPETIEQEVRQEPVQQQQPPLTAKEKKQLEKEQKEKLKKEKEMEKMRKKEEEKEKKRLEKERKALLLAEKKAAKQKSKQKGSSLERRDSKSSKNSMDMKGDWEEAQSQEHPGSVTPDRTVKRFSSFEERKEKGVDIVDDDYDDDDDDEPPPPPEPLDGSLKGRQKGRRGMKKEVESASQASDYGTDEENLKEHRREQRRRDDAYDDNEEVSF